MTFDAICHRVVEGLSDLMEGLCGQVTTGGGAKHRKSSSTVLSLLHKCHYCVAHLTISMTTDGPHLECCRGTAPQVCVSHDV